MNNKIRLSLLSFNLWDDKYYRLERLEWFTDYIKNNTPELVLLQEVTNSIVIELSKKLHELNYQFKISGSSRTRYEMICSRFPIQSHKTNIYSNSKTKRGLITTTIKINDVCNITLVSTQLEQDSKSRNIRAAQFECLFKSFSNISGNVIMAVDTGLSKDEIIQVSDEWKDAWEQSGRNKYLQYTIDNRKNANVIDEDQRRSMRIYYKGDIEDLEYKLIGEEGLQNLKSKIVYPSLQFGPFITFKLAMNGKT